MLRPTVSRSVYLGIKHRSGAYDQIFYHRQTFAGLLMWDSLSDESTGLYLQCWWASPAQSFSGRVPFDSRPYFTVSDSRLPVSSPPTTRRATPLPQGNLSLSLSLSLDSVLYHLHGLEAGHRKHIRCPKPDICEQ
jgi:hypothetical protein